jgi:hypothetical protein
MCNLFARFGELLKARGGEDRVLEEKRNAGAEARGRGPAITHALCFVSVAFPIEVSEHVWLFSCWVQELVWFREQGSTMLRVHALPRNFLISYIFRILDSKFKHPRKKMRKIRLIIKVMLSILRKLRFILNSWLMI